MPTSHSKRNTSLAFFTSHERNELKTRWGSQQTRLNRNSFLPFGACRLCLLHAKDPVSCPSHGHIFCRECILHNLVAQRQEIKRVEKQWRKGVEDDQYRADQKDAIVHDQDVQKFEDTLAGLGDTVVPRSDNKRKSLHDQESQAISNKRTSHDKTQDGNSALPSFWVPSKTPTAVTDLAVKPVKISPACPASTPTSAHDISLKTLVQIKFEQGPGRDGAEAIRTCPSCHKALSNTSKAVLAKPCGHVLCKSCADRSLKPTEADAHDQSAQVGIVHCFVCQDSLTPSTADHDQDAKHKKDAISPGLVEICCDGTGFAGGGDNMVKKSGIAFQC